MERDFDDDDKLADAFGLVAIDRDAEEARKEQDFDDTPSVLFLSQDLATFSFSKGSAVTTVVVVLEGRHRAPAVRLRVVATIE